MKLVLLKRIYYIIKEIILHPFETPYVTVNEDGLVIIERIKEIK